MKTKLSIITLISFLYLFISCDSKLDYSDSKIDIYEIKGSSKTIIESDTLFKSKSEDVVLHFITQAPNDFPTKIFLRTEKREKMDITDVSPGAVSVAGIDNSTGYSITFESEVKNIKYLGDTLTYNIQINNLISKELVVVLK